MIRNSLWLATGPLCLFMFSGLAEANTLYFPQAVVGDGYSTTFTLINTDSIALSGQLRVFNQDGSSRSTPFEWESILIPAAGSARFTLSGSGKLTVGSAYFQSSSSVSGTATFERRNADGTLEALASLLGTAASSRFLLPVEISSSGSTGIALMNVAAASTSVRVKLFAENGSTVSISTDPRLSSFGGRTQIAALVTDLFPELGLTDFRGTLLIEVAGFTNEIAAAGIIVKEGLLAGLPVIASFAPPPPTRIIMGLAGRPPSSVIFQTRKMEAPTSRNFALSPGVYEVTGKVSGTLMVALAAPSPSSSAVVAGSLRNIQGADVRIFPCFIVYTSLAGTQSFTFQFTVSADTAHPCKNAIADNPLTGPDDDGRAVTVSAVTVSGPSVVVAGISRVKDGQNFVVRAYNTSSGELRWTDQTPTSPDLNTWVFAASSGERVFAAAYSPSIPCCSNIFVRAYDANNGRVLWTDVWHRGRDDLPQGIVASSAVVVVVGYGGNTATAPISALDSLVRAYQPATGRVLWEDHVNNGFLVDDVAWAVTIDGTRVFVAGTSSTSDGSTDLVVRAYDVMMGALFWETLRKGMSRPIALFGTDYGDIASPAQVQSVIARDLMVSRNWRNYRPDESFVTSFSGGKTAAIKGRTAAMVYLATAFTFVHIDMSRLNSTGTVLVRRFNPVDGTITTVGDFPAVGTQTFDTGGLPDAVLLFDAITADR